MSNLTYINLIRMQLYYLSMINEKLLQETNKFVEEYYLPQLFKGILEVENMPIEKISNKIATAILGGKHIFSFGNGGSEAISELFIQSLEQNISTEFQFDTFSNPKLSESKGIPNEELFNHKIKRSGKKGDLIILISASGNSENIKKASILCKEKGIETISISGNGEIVNNPEIKSDLAIVLNIKDQQILEDITLALINIIVDLVLHKVNKLNYSLEKIKEKQLYNLKKGILTIKENKIFNIAERIIKAYHEGKIIRIDAPESCGLSISAKHMEHNLKWDAFQNIKNRLKNKVNSGLSTYHLTGVGNDGGDNFNYAIEIKDNAESEDFEIIFAKNINSLQIRSLLLEANNKKMDIEIFNFNIGNDFTEACLAQIILHLTSRIINTRLLLEEESITQNQFKQQLQYDLAMLRTKPQTRIKLEQEYNL